MSQDSPAQLGSSPPWYRVMTWTSRVNNRVHALRRTSQLLLKEEQEDGEDAAKDVHVGSFPWLRFEGAPHACGLLEDEFYLVNATQFRSVLRMVSSAAIVWFAVYTSIVWNLPSTDWTSRAFYLSIVAGLPCLYLFLSTEFWLRHSQSTTLLLFVVCGGFFVAHKVLIQDYSNMIMTLYVIVVFTATPLTLVNAACCAGSIIFSYLLIAFVQISLLSTRVPDPPVRLQDIYVLGLTNVLSFVFLVYVTYYRELSLRKAIISHHVLLAKSREVEHEVEKTHRLLLSMLPDVICEKLKVRDADPEGGEEAADVTPLRIAEKFSSVTVMFVEVCNFNQISAEQTQGEVLDILNTIYSVFDSVVEEYDVYKVETVGSVYLVVGGCPRRSLRHSEDIGELALEFMSAVQGINQILRTTMPNLRASIEIRIGLNAGAIVAGVVGQKSPRFKLFGDPVNTASRMQSTCPPGKIQCSANAYKALRSKFDLEHRGKITVKGKGEMDTYFLVARKDTIAQGRTVIKDRDEMHQQIANNQTVLFRSYYEPMSKDGSQRSLPRAHAPPPLSSGAKVAPLALDQLERLDNKSMDSKKESSSTEDPARTPPDSAALNDSMSGSSKKGAHQMRLPPHSSEGYGSRLRGALHSVFYLGPPEFRQQQFRRGVVNITRFATLLLCVLPPGLVSTIVVYVVVDHERLPFAEMWPFLMASMGLVSLLLALLKYIVLSNSRKASLLPLIVCLSFVCVAGFLVGFNTISTFPNASFLMVSATFFFNLAVVPMTLRVLLPVLASIANCACLYVFLKIQESNREAGARHYKRYMLGDGQNIMDEQDLLLQLVLLIVTIVLQTWCVATQERFLYQDFTNNLTTTHQNTLLHKQKAQTYSLLSQLLPQSIVPKLVQGGLSQVRIVDRFDNVTVLFTDMVNFTSFSQKVTPLQLMDFLNFMYTRFDAITDKYNLYKVEIIGDAYFIVGGCPDMTEDHTARVLLAAQEMLAVLPELCVVAHETLKQQQRSQKEKWLKENRLKNVMLSTENKLTITDLLEADRESALKDQDRDQPLGAGPGSPHQHQHHGLRPPEQGPQPGLVMKANHRYNDKSQAASASASACSGVDGGGSRAFCSGGASDFYLDESQFDMEVPMPDISIRVGVNVGSVIAGVVGVMDPRYHVFGDAVSLANMMESKSKPGKVHISQRTLENLQKNPEHASFFETEAREPIDLSPIAGPQTTYFCRLAKDPHPLEKELVGSRPRSTINVKQATVQYIAN
jgi:class 3 adenylate cyclase